jgi:hypothetical protein
MNYVLDACALIALSGRFVSSDHHELEIINRQERVEFFWFR